MRVLSETYNPSIASRLVRSNSVACRHPTPNYRADNHPSVPLPMSRASSRTCNPISTVGSDEILNMGHQIFICYRQSRRSGPACPCSPVLILAMVDLNLVTMGVMFYCNLAHAMTPYQGSHHLLATSTGIEIGHKTMQELTAYSKIVTPYLFTIVTPGLLLIC
jgi:hypothetical protein